MKRKIFSILFALVLVLSFSLVTAVPVAAASEVWVDDDAAVDGDGTEALPFDTIQEGINAVDPSGTVNVAPGTYEESLEINKCLTLVSTEGPENTKIDVPSGPGIEIKASGVIVEGFSVSGDALHYGIIVRKGVGVEVLNNVITGTTRHEAIELYEGDLAEITVSGNVIDNCAYGIVVGGGKSFSISGCTISGNTITGSTGGGWGAIPCSGEISDITISGNEISNNEGMPGILLGSGTYENIVVEKNTVSNNLNGVQIKYVADFTNLAINHNNICGNDEYGILNDSIETVNATNNWWGSASGPTHALNTYTAPGDEPQGDAVSDNVLYVPWLDKAFPEGASFAPVTLDTEPVGQFSSIQAAINAATHTTITCKAGTYSENVVILPDRDNLQLLGAGSSETSITPASGKPVLLKGWDMLPERPLDGVRIQGFTLVIADGSHAILAGSGTNDGSTYTTNLELEDIVVDGGQRGIGLNAVAGVTLSEVHLSNISGSPEAALELTGVSNLLFTQGSIVGNDIGVRLQPTGSGDVGEGYGPNGNIQIHFTNFCGNGIAIENQDDSFEIDATNNYWCHPSGPTASPGYGDPVSANVLYDPWLLEPVVPGAPLPTPFDKTLALNIDWTLVSTDSWLDPAETVGVNVILAINYTPDDGWFEVDPTALVPVDALYLKTEEGGALGIIYSGGVPVASSKNLEAGWNLVSSATIGNAKDILSPLRYIDVGEEQGVGLATLVSQGPPLNHNSLSFYQSTVVIGDWMALGNIMLNPFDGYWVYMNDGKSFGVVPGAQP